MNMNKLLTAINLLNRSKSYGVLMLKKNYRYLISISLFFLNFLPISSAAQELNEVGQLKITEVLEKSLEEFKIPGFVALVTNSDKNIYSEAFGLANVAKGEPMQVDSIFQIASMTKPITSAGLMILVQQGLVKLDDNISDHINDLPPFEIFEQVNLETGKFSTKIAKNPVTIRHLFTHTSGLAYNFNSFELAATNQPLFNPERYLLQHEPGEKWTYGPSTNLLGEVIEEHSGLGLFEYMQEELFIPLSMEETFFVVPDSKLTRVVTRHAKVGDNFSELPQPSRVASPELGHGGLSSTAPDYAKFMRLFLRDGITDSGVRIFDPSTINLISRNHIGELRAELQPASRPDFAKAFPQRPGIDTWGLGFQLSGSSELNERSVGSMSWAGIFNTEFWIDREKNIAAVLMMQYLPFDDEVHIEILKRFEEAIYTNLN